MLTDWVIPTDLYISGNSLCDLHNKLAPPKVPGCCKHLPWIQDGRQRKQFFDRLTCKWCMQVMSAQSYIQSGKRYGNACMAYS